MKQFDTQVRHATAFLKKHKTALRRFATYPGVEQIAVDFGIELRNVTIHSDWLPAAFLKAAANAKVDVELSHYPWIPKK
jgi:hypothetical protein